MKNSHKTILAGIVIVLIALTVVLISQTKAPESNSVNNTLKSYVTSTISSNSFTSSANKTGPFLMQNQSQFLFEPYNKSIAIDYVEYFTQPADLSYPYYPTASNPNTYISSSWMLPFYYNIQGVWSVEVSRPLNPNGEASVQESVMQINSTNNNTGKFNTTCAYAIYVEVENIDSSSGGGGGYTETSHVVSTTNYTGTHDGMNYTYSIFAINNTVLGNGIGGNFTPTVLTNETITCGIKGNTVAIVWASILNSYKNATPGGVNQTALINYMSSNM